MLLFRGIADGRVGMCPGHKNARKHTHTAFVELEVYCDNQLTFIVMVSIKFGT